jgi:hypothetical protein
MERHLAAWLPEVEIPAHAPYFSRLVRQNFSIRRHFCCACFPARIKSAPKNIKSAYNPLYLLLFL